MPNCDFYATPDDHQGILSWLLSEGSCRIYELASEVGKPLQQFQSPEEVIKLFERSYTGGKKWDSVHLQLYVIDASPPFIPQRCTLDPKACNGATFRYEAKGWGLVQLYLSAPKSDNLGSSHTNHNSQKRAETWATTIADMGNPSAWNFKRISAFSSRLNREINKRRVGKIGSRAILPGAIRLWEAGLPLWPYIPGQNTIVDER